MIELLKELDQQLFLFLNGLHSGFFDWLMYYISYKYTWTPFYMLLLWLFTREYGYRGLLVIGFVVLLIFLSDQVSVLMKNTFMRLRPCHEPSLQGLVHIVRDHCGGRYGFVSSHAANSFALAVFTGFALRRRWPRIMWLMLLWASLKAYSRIYLGVHYPGDVIVGGLLGAGIGIAVYMPWQYLFAWFQKRRPDAG